MAGAIYGTVAAVMGGTFLWLALRVRRARDDASARRLFGFSILYLYALVAALIAEHGAAGAWLAGGGLG